MIHSGSRNLGKQVADHYNKLAVGLNEKWHSSIPKEHELAFLPLDSEEGKSYLREMQYCVDYALVNRKLMMNRIKNIFFDVCTGLNAMPVKDPLLNTKDRLHHISFDEMINIAHNYARLENHYGKNVWVHRKGATSAKEGEIGIIPGSQGTKSYIVKGKGNKESFESCSHGAGRKMGRQQAKRELDLEVEKKRLDDMRVLHAIREV